mgnify:CR=1 FL=1|tara:strand:- start:15163 stop:16536 length:1374 start_codon:yes stop_codon:yes gene_type:complete
MARSIPFFFIFLFIALFIPLFPSISIDQTLTLLLYLASAGFLYLHLKKTNFLFDSVLIFYISFVIFIAIGAIIFLNDSSFLINTLSSGDDLNNILDKYSLYMSIGFFTFIFSSFVFLFFREHLLLNKKTIPINSRFIISIVFLISLFISVVGFLLEPNYVSNLSQFFSGSLDGRDIRMATTLEDSNSSYAGKGIVNVIKYQLLPFMSLAFIILNKNRRFLILSTILVVFIVLIGEFRRAPALFFLISIFFYFLFFDNSLKKSPSVMKLFFYFIIFILAYTLLSLTLGRSSESIFLFTYELLYRIFISSAQTGTYIFQIIPAIMPELNGSSYIQNLPSFITGMDDWSFAAEIFYYIHGRQGGASFSFISEGYANFGIYGIFLTTILLSLLFSCVEYNFQKRSSDYLELAFYIFFLINLVPAFVMGSLVGPMINIILVRITIFLMNLVAILLFSVNRKN